MYELNDVSNESKDYINLYNMIPSLKLNNPKKEKRNSLNLTNLSKSSINLRKKSLLSENSNNTNSINKIQKIKDFMPNKENSYNKKKDSISFKGTNFPICLSFMTNSKNYITCNVLYSMCMLNNISNGTIKRRGRVIFNNNRFVFK